MKLVAEAGVGRGRGRRREGARRRRSTSRAPTAAPARARSARSRTRACRGSSASPRRSRSLVENGLRGRVRLRVDGGIKTGRDVIVAALLGADECQLRHRAADRRGLPDGALVPRRHLPRRHRDPAARAARQVRGTPEMVESYLLLVAEEVRSHLAALGLRSFDEAVGRSDLLRRRAVEGRARLLDLDALLTPASGETRFQRSDLPDVQGGELGETVSAQPQGSYAISNRDRAVGARLAGRLARDGEPAAALDVGPVHRHGRPELRRLPSRRCGVRPRGRGERLRRQGHERRAHRRRGRLPPTRATHASPATPSSTAPPAGELFCAGSAGERFAVRNSGATAVVEGAGDHLCEYMTRGTVVVLGDFGRNVGGRHDRRRALRPRPGRPAGAAAQRAARRGRPSSTRPRPSACATCSNGTPS